MGVFVVLIVGVLLFIFFQDVKLRAVYWFLFPVLMALSFLLTWKSLTMDWLWNILFLSLMMGMLTVYVSLKNKKWVNIANGYFSWGDILFLLAVTPLFTFRLYVLFFTAGTIFVLLLHLMTISFRKEDTIPYAGYMSLALIPVIVFNDQIISFLNVV